MKESMKTINSLHSKKLWYTVDDKIERQKRGAVMRYLVTFFWVFILGQVIGYLGSSLGGGTYNFTLTAVVSLIVGAIVILLGILAPDSKKTT